MLRAAIISALPFLHGSATGEPCRAFPLRRSDLPRACRRLSRRDHKRLRQLPACVEAEEGEICLGTGECGGTSQGLNNCGWYDIYERDYMEDGEAAYYEEEEEDDFHDDDDDYHDDDDDHEQEEDEEELQPSRQPTRRPTATPPTTQPAAPTDQNQVSPTRQPTRRQVVNEPQPTSQPPTARPAAVPTTGSFPSDIRKWPAYSQQCFDDAGPAFGDDAEIYGPGNKFHTQSNAIAVLTPDNQCADPVKAGCQARALASGGGDVTSAIALESYLEGPLQCGGKGWFCRILPDERNSRVLRSDYNFNHCNASDYGDTGGHCHGSDDDDTFYWWVRDHWHRGYAGRLHCCCDWQATNGVVSRCDYRAPLQPGENEQCRDANEDHNGPGSGFSKGFEAGCANLGRNPLPEPAEAQCWDVLNFAPLEE